MTKEDTKTILIDIGDGVAKLALERGILTELANGYKHVETWHSSSDATKLYPTSMQLFQPQEDGVHAVWLGSYSTIKGLYEALKSVFESEENSQKG